MPPKLKEEEEEEEEEEVEEEEAEEEEVVEVTEEEEEVEEEEAEEEEEEEDVEVAEVTRPEDEEKEKRGSVSTGKTFGISNKVLLLAGIGAALLVIYLKFIRSKANSTTKDYSEGEVEEEVAEAMEDEPEGPNIRRSDSDPLAADEEAMTYIFEDQQ